MVGYIVTMLVGIACIGIGIANRRGNISMLHSYHIHRVAKEDTLPMGKKVGLGMIILGGSLSASGAVSIIGVLLQAEVLEKISVIVMFVGIVVGCVITVQAINKYNKGLF